MKVFVTGGTGLIGSRLIPRLIASGHTVTCLARSDKSASAAKALGAVPVMGDRLDLKVLAQAAGEADAVVHLAFDHDRFDDYDKVCEEDRTIITAMCDALGSTNKPFVLASGTLGTDGDTEECEVNRAGKMTRWKSDDLAYSYLDKGVKAMVVRICPVAHTEDRQHPFIAIQIAVAKKLGKVAYVKEGQNVWPAAYVDDVAEVFALTLEKGEAGKNYHAVVEEGVSTRDIAQTIAERLSLPTESITAEEALSRFGFIGALLNMDNKTSSALTQERLGWTPKGRGLIDEINGWKEL